MLQGRYKICPLLMRFRKSKNKRALMAPYPSSVISKSQFNSHTSNLCKNRCQNKNINKLYKAFQLAILNITLRLILDSFSTLSQTSPGFYVSAVQAF